MAASSADTRRPFGGIGSAPPEPEAGGGGRAHLGAVVALTVILALASLGVAIAAVLLVTSPDLSLPVNRLGPQQSQSAKTALYLAAYAVVLPLSLIAAPRLADAIAGGPNARALDSLATLLAAGLAAAILGVRASGRLPWGDGMAVLLVALGIWWLGAAAALTRALRPRPWPALLRLSGLGSRPAIVAGVLVYGVLVCVSHASALSLPVVGLGAAAVASCLIARRRVPRLPRRAGAVLDLAIAGVLLLAIPDVVVFETSSAPLSAWWEPGIIQFHHDFLLGPANQVLAGDALLVDAPVSQYGVGSIYALVAWFQVAPIGYGTYGLLDGILTALVYVAAYCLLRLVGVSRPLAGAALAVGVVALLYNLHYAVGALPQQGPLRFGLPMAAVLATVVAARRPRRARAARLAALAVLGISSIWALEAFVYTLVTLTAVAACHAWLEAPGHRLRSLAPQAAAAALACVCAHLFLAGATLAATGRLPDWGQYLSYVDAFLLGGAAGEVTYGFEPWSPALALGAAYLASAAAIVLVVRRLGEIAERQQGLLIALAGMTAYGIALFSYTQNRASTYLLAYVSLPALVIGVLWLSLLLRLPRDVPVGTRRGALAAGLSVAVLLLAAAWPGTGDRFSRSALAHTYPGGGLRAAMQRLWHPPPIDPRAPVGERLLERYMPGERRALILLPASPDLGTEILLRSGRANVLALGDPKADSFVLDVSIPALERSIAGLPPGTRMLTDQAGLAAFETLSANPGIDPFSKTVTGGNPLLEWTLRSIGERYDLRPIHRDASGFIVAELVRTGS